MRLQKINLTPIFFAHFLDKTPITDDEGYETGEYRLNYSEPVMVMANVSPGTGYMRRMPFGNLPSWDRIILVEDVYCEMDENSVLYIPEHPEDIPEDLRDIEYNHIVLRKSPSLNHVAYAVQKTTGSK